MSSAVCVTCHELPYPSSVNTALRAAALHGNSPHAKRRHLGYLALQILGIILQGSQLRLRSVVPFSPCLFFLQLSSNLTPILFTYHSNLLRPVFRRCISEKLLGHIQFSFI